MVSLVLSSSFTQMLLQKTLEIANQVKLIVKRNQAATIGKLGLEELGRALVKMTAIPTKLVKDWVKSWILFIMIYKTTLIQPYVSKYLSIKREYRLGILVFS
jgi:hypothetical protein